MTKHSPIFFSALIAHLVLASPHKPSSIGQVHRGTLIQKVTVAGVILPNKRTVITPPYNAYIKKIHVRIGEQVAAGTPVVTLVQSLRGSEDEVYPLRAPFSGTVVQVLKSEGEYVEQLKENSQIIRIDDMTRLFVTASIPEADISRIEKGQQVSFKANAILEKNYLGVVRDISLAAKEGKDWSRRDQVEFEVRMEVADKDPKLLPGMSVIIDIITARKENVLLLDHEYVEKRKDAYYVTLEIGKKQLVEVGSRNSEVFEVMSGLAEHARVRMVDFESIAKENL